MDMVNRIQILNEAVCITFRVISKENTQDKKQLNALTLSYISK